MICNNQNQPIRIPLNLPKTEYFKFDRVFLPIPNQNVWFNFLSYSVLAHTFNDKGRNRSLLLRKFHLGKKKKKIQKPSAYKEIAQASKHWQDWYWNCPGHTDSDVINIRYWLRPHRYNYSILTIAGIDSDCVWRTVRWLSVVAIYTSWGIIVQSALQLRREVALFSCNKSTVPGTTVRFW